jgi:uncharacterized protein (UPF0248 family)
MGREKPECLFSQVQIRAQHQGARESKFKIILRKIEAAKKLFAVPQ